MSRRISAHQVEAFMRARAKRARRMRRDGGMLTCVHHVLNNYGAIVPVACGAPATHVAVEGLRCEAHLEGTNYAQRI